MSTDTSALPVTLTRDGAVALLSFNRPEALNALDIASAQAFAAACRSIAADAGVRAVVMRGEGKAFGAGGDVAHMHAGSGAVAQQLIDAMHEGVRLLARIDAPVIASLHGVVAGGSLSLAASCDLAIAAEGTRFNLAYTNIGASCDVSASWSLPRLVGLRNAMQIALLSDAFDAAEALRLGLVNRVVPADQLSATVMTLAQRIAAGPTRAYGHMKRLMRQSFEHDFSTQLDAERDAFVDCTRTADFTEGIAAFAGKRKPQFSGR